CGDDGVGRRIDDRHVARTEISDVRERRCPRCGAGNTERNGQTKRCELWPHGSPFLRMTGLSQISYQATFCRTHPADPTFVPLPTGLPRIRYGKTLSTDQATSHRTCVAFMYAIDPCCAA